MFLKINLIVLLSLCLKITPTRELLRTRMLVKIDST